MQDDIDSYLALGNSHMQNKEYSLAINCYIEFLKVYPTNVFCLYNLGGAFFQQNIWEKAVICFEKVSAIDNNHFEAYFYSGIALYHLGNMDVAIAKLLKALQINPNDVGTRWFLGNIYKQIGDLSKASKQYEAVLRNNPDFAEAKQALAEIKFVQAQVESELNQAYKHYQNGELNKAEAIYHSILKKYPVSVFVTFFLGMNTTNIDDSDDSHLNSAMDFIYALRFFCSGNLSQTDALCRKALQKSEDTYWANILLNLVAQQLGDLETSIYYINKAIRSIDSNVQCQVNLKSPENKYLLIKAWGCGLWSDIEHVLGQLLLADMVGRIPVVYWGTESLYYNPGMENAFTEYFVEISKYSIQDLIQEEFTFFPYMWNKHNLLEKEPGKYLRELYKEAGISFFNRQETVLVSDSHIDVERLIPWLKPDHPLFGCDSFTAYQYLYRKYIKLAPNINEEIERFYSQYMQNRKLIAVHVRAGDRMESLEKLCSNNELYYGKIKEFMQKDSDWLIFLLTDSQYVVQEFRKVYGEKLVFTDCYRTDGNVGVHYDRRVSDKFTIGKEAILDVYLAARCDYFIGCNSNVSAAVMRLKKWDHDNIYIFEHLPSTFL